MEKSVDETPVDMNMGVFRAEGELILQLRESCVALGMEFGLNKRHAVYLRSDTSTTSILENVKH